MNLESFLSNFWGSYHFCSFLEAEGLEEGLVGAVDDGVVHLVEVDSGYFFGGVAHAFGDDGDGDSGVVGGGGPGVSGGVGGEGGEACLEGHGAECFVIGGEAALVFLEGSFALSLYDGEDVDGVVAGPSVYDVAHAGLHADGEWGAGLVAPVEDVAVRDVVFLEGGHVDEGHAAGCETEEEHVPPHGRASGEL